jgi:hypothetical protein
VKKPGTKYLLANPLPYTVHMLYHSVYIGKLHISTNKDIEKDRDKFIFIFERERDRERERKRHI